jgi:hypothetical protein
MAPQSATLSSQITETAEPGSVNAKTLQGCWLTTALKEYKAKYPCLNTEHPLPCRKCIAAMQYGQLKTSVVGLN